MNHSVREHTRTIEHVRPEKILIRLRTRSLFRIFFGRISDSQKSKSLYVDN